MTLKSARFVSLTALIAALLLAVPVQLRAETPAATADTTATDSGMDDLTTGTISVTPAEKRKRRFDDCMSIWEPATHMTKREWRRTCKNQLTEEPNL